MSTEAIQRPRAAAYIAMTLVHVFAVIAQANGRRVGTIEVQERLQAIGRDICLRTIQRHLLALKDNSAPIECDGCSPQGWFLKKHPAAGEQGLADAVVLMLEAA